MKRFIQLTAGQLTRSTGPNYVQGQPLLSVVSQTQAKLNVCSSLLNVSRHAFSQTAIRGVSKSGNQSDDGKKKRRSLWDTLTGSSSCDDRTSKNAPNRQSTTSSASRGPRDQNKQRSSRNKNTDNCQPDNERQQQQQYKTTNNYERQQKSMKSSKKDKQQFVQQNQSSRSGGNVNSRSAKTTTPTSDSKRANKFSPPDNQRFDTLSNSKDDKSASSRARGSSSSSADRRKNSRFTNDKMSSSSNGKVEHCKNENKFTLDLGDGQKAFIEYRQTGDGVVEMYHTEVPEQMRGKGIGRQLARGALEQAQKANLKCKMTCSYLLDYMKRFANENERKSVVD